MEIDLGKILDEFDVQGHRSKFKVMGLKNVIGAKELYNTGRGRCVNAQAFSLFFCAGITKFVGVAVKTGHAGFF